MRRFVQAISAASVLPKGLPDALVRALLDAPDRYNIGKGQPATVLWSSSEGTRASEMVWGLVPRWSKEPATPYTTVTARLDRAASSRIFSQAWQQRPCVVAMSGYYKWDRQRRPPWPRFLLQSNGQALLAAGLWERWQGEEQAPMDSFALLTAPNPAIPAPLTPDGPVFLDCAGALAWLGGAINAPATLAARAQRPDLESYPVSRAVANPARDDYTLLEPVDPDADGAAGGDLDEQAWDEVED